MCSKVRCPKCCKRKRKSPYWQKKQEEKEALQLEIEKSVAEHAEKANLQGKIEHYGKNDSFFAGEEFKDLETLNPNVDMGFQKFALRPNPDFIVQMTPRQELDTQDNQDAN